MFHLAAAVGVKLVCEAPIHTIHTNVDGTAVVLAAAKRYGRRVLVASTSEVYGKSDRFPIPKKPTSCLARLPKRAGATPQASCSMSFSQSDTEGKSAGPPRHRRASVQYCRSAAESAATEWCCRHS